jgi:hypothetical protein
MNEEQKFILEGENMGPPWAGKELINEWIPSEGKLTILPFKADYEWMNEWMNEEQELAIFCVRADYKWMKKKEISHTSIDYVWMNGWMNEWMNVQGCEGRF